MKGRKAMQADKEKVKERVKSEDKGKTVEMTVNMVVVLVVVVRCGGLWEWVERSEGGNDGVGVVVLQREGMEGEGEGEYKQTA